MRNVWRIVAMWIVAVAASFYCLHRPVPVFAAASTDTLVGYWKLDETSAGTFADASGSGYTMTGAGAGGTNSTAQPIMEKPTLSFGNVRAVDFDGTDDYLTAGADAALELDVSDKTISAWVRRETSSTFALVDKEFDNGGSDYGGWGVWIQSNGKLQWWVHREKDILDDGPLSIPLNAWTHVVLTWDVSSKTVTFYYDGVLATTKTDETIVEKASGAAPLLIGAARGASTFFMNGQIDDVRLYSRILSESEIVDLASGNHPTAVWDGSSSDDFEAAANWDIGAIPDPYTNLLIPAAGNHPALSRAASGASLTIEEGAFFDLRGFDFAFTDDGSLKSGGTLKLRGSETTNPSDVGSTSTGTVLYYGTGSYSGLAAGDSYYNLMINDGLVGYWKFDENGGGVAGDSSGYRQRGTFQNGATFVSTTPGTAFANPSSAIFDGDDDHILINSPISLPVGNAPYAISVWINPNAMDDTMGIVGWGNYGDDEQVNALRLTSNGINNYWWSNDLAVTTPNLIGSWNHIVAMFDGTTRSIYLNGTLVGSDTPGSPNVGATALRIGVTHSDFAEFFDGRIDDLRIYNRALASHEIASLAAGHQPAIASGTFTLDENVTVVGDLVLAGGNLDVSGTNKAVTAKGSWLNHGGRFTPRAGTVDFRGTSGIHTLQSGGQAFHDINFQDPATYALGDRLNIGGTLTLASGALDVTTSNYGIHTNDFNQAGGVFTSRSGIVTLHGPGNGSPVISSTLHDLHIEAPAESGLVGYWKFDECQTATAKDVSGNGHHGTLAGSPRWTGDSASAVTTFVNSCAMAFNGSGALVEAPRSGDFELQEFTYAAWIRLSPDAEQWNTILSYGRGTELGGEQATESTSLSYDVATDRLRLRLKAADDSSIIDLLRNPGDDIEDRWVHIAATWNGSTATLYLDGDSLGTATNAGTVNYANHVDSTLRIGNWFGNDERWFHGAIDDVRVYDKALSPAEVQNLANGAYADGASTEATFSLSSNLSLDSMHVLSGKFNAGNRTIDVSGDWNNYAGTSAFIRSSSIVNINGDGTQNIRGSTDFYNLAITADSARTVRFASGETQSVDNFVTFAGQDGGILTLEPITASTAWYLDVDVGATQSIAYVSPSYSDASSGAEIDADDGTSIDGGNNVHWLFPSPEPSNDDVPSAASSGRSGGHAGRAGPGGDPFSSLANQARLSIMQRFADQLSGGTSDRARVVSGTGSSPSRDAVSPKAPLPSPLQRISKQRGRLFVLVDDEHVLFRDVIVTEWYAPYIASLIEGGVAYGYRDGEGKLTGEFGVANPITKAEVLKMALEAAERKISGKPPRNPSAQGTWAAPYVGAAEEMGLTVFPVHAPVHVPAMRGEVMQILLEVMGLPVGRSSSGFSDVPDTHPYDKAIATAAFYGIIEGDTDGDGTPLNTFRPDDHVNRAEVAKIIALLREILEQTAR